MRPCLLINEANRPQLFPSNLGDLALAPQLRLGPTAQSFCLSEAVQATMSAPGNGGTPGLPSGPIAACHCCF